jgi:hypothetical protein
MQKNLIFNIRPEYHKLDELAYIKMMFTQSKNASGKIALVVDDLNLSHLEKIGQKWHIIPDFNIFVSQCGFSFWSNNFFYHIVDETIQKLLPSGIMNHFLKMFIISQVIMRKFENGPKVLTFENLKFWICHLAWMLCCLYNLLAL